MSLKFEATTDNIRVSVRPVYLQDHSEPDEAKFVWAYTIDVENLSNQIVQLLNRHWIITDATGKVEEVKGPGVIGKQPRLNPGQGFNYTSFCHLKTDSGFMGGTFEMINHSKDKASAVSNEGFLFSVEIPVFSLDLPNLAKALN